MGIRINDNGPAHPPINITITGVTGSGKTLLAAFIAQALDNVGVETIRVFDNDLADVKTSWEKSEVLRTHPDVVGEVIITTVAAKTGVTKR